MKDAYSFDLDDAGLQKSYDLHREAYVRIFDRLGLDYRIVSAVSGAMGGSASEEFLAPTPVGEDTFVTCANCGYAANVEAVPSVPPPVDPSVEHPPMAEIPTPDTPTIETLAAALGVPASATLKNVLVKVDGEPVAIGVPGDREVDLVRLEAALAPAVIEPFEAADFAAHPELVRGYIGPQAGLTTYYARPAGRARVPPGSPGRTSPTPTSPTPSPGRDFTVDDTWTSPTSSRATPARAAVRSWRWTGRSRSATSSSSAASTPTRSVSTCWARTASRSA